MKNKKIISIIFVILIITIVGILLYNIITNNQSIFKGDRVKNSDLYTLNFSYMNQNDEHTLFLQKDSILKIQYEIKKGKVDIYVGIKGRDYIYKGNDIDSGKFDLTIPESGNYTIYINANKATGFAEFNLKD